MLVLSASLLRHAAPAQALPSETPDDTWVTDGRVSTVVQAGDRIYLGGTFTRVGPNTGRGVSVDATTGDLVSGFPKVDGDVYAAVPDGSGGWYIGGDFTQVEGVFRANAAHVRSDGSLSPWAPRPNDPVRALAFLPTIERVFLGGDFSNVKGVARTFLAAVDSNRGDVDGGFEATLNGPVHALAVPSDVSRLYAGGLFTSVNGSERNRLASLSPSSGALDGTVPGANGDVESLVLSPDGATAFAGGSFTTLGGAARNRAGSFSTATGEVTGWDPNASNTVRALAISPDASTLYAGGDFNAIGGASRSFIAALDAGTGGALAFAPALNGSVSSLALPEDGATVYAGGAFTTAQGTGRSHAAAFQSGTGALIRGWDPEPNHAVHAVSAAGGQVFLGGAFTSIGGLRRSNLAALLASTGEVDPNWNPSPSGPVNAMVLSADGNSLYVGGSFNKAGGANRPRLAKIDAVSGAVDNKWSPRVAGGQVLALARIDNRLYAGGNFDTVNGVAMPALAAIDGSSGEVDTAFSPRPDQKVSGLDVSPDGSRLYAGGQFSSIGGRNQRKFAAVDPATGAASAWAPNVGFPVLAVDVSSDGSSVCVGGAGGRTNGNRTACYDPSADGDPRWFQSGDGNVQSVLIVGSIVYSGGHFDTMGGLERKKLVAQDLADGSVLAWAPVVNSALGVWSVARGSGPEGLLVGGDFTKVGNSSQEGIARLAGTL